MNLSETLLTSSTIQIVGWALLHSLWQGVVLAMILSGALSVLRKKSANRRYLISCVTLLLMLILPVGTSLLSNTEYGDMQFDNMMSQKTIPVELASTARNDFNLPDNTPTDAVFQSWTSRAAQQIAFLLPWLALMWLLGVFTVSLRLVGGWNYTQRLRKNKKQLILGQWQQNLECLSRRLLITKPVVLLESSLVKVPTVIGWLRPLILIPPCAVAGLTPQQLESIIAHELAHIQRHDYLVNLFQIVVETLLFYHPAVRWVSLQIRRERENACDDLAVTAIGGDALVYARALTKMERLRKTTVPSPLVMAVDGGTSSLTDRIHRLIRVETPSPKRSAGFLTTLMVCTFIIAIGANSQILSFNNSVSGNGKMENLQFDNSKLLEKISSLSAVERAKAICSLGKTGDSAVLPVLIQGLSDEEAIPSPVKCWVSEDWSPLYETFKQPSPGEEAAIALASMGENAIEPLLAVLRNSNPVVRRNAAWALGEIRDGDKVNRQAAIEPLIDALKDGDQWVRRAAAFALSEIKVVKAAPLLIAALKDEKSGVREMAAYALGEMKEPSAVDALQNALTDEDSRVRKMAKWSLSEINDR